MVWVGWGTAVTDDRVWISGFNGKILVMDLDGHPVGTESDIPLTKGLFGLMGVGVAPDGDIWMRWPGQSNAVLPQADGSKTERS